MSIWGDLGGLASDAWQGKNTDGDMAAVTVDTLSKIPGLDEFLPDGGEAKSAVDGVEKWAGVPENNSGGNLGNEIGTVAGGLLGMVGGPLGAAMGMSAGSKAGGFIADLFGGGGDSPSQGVGSMTGPIGPLLGPGGPVQTIGQPSGPVNYKYEQGPGFLCD
jgi:hypothetical protein